MAPTSSGACSDICRHDCCHHHGSLNSRSQAGTPCSPGLPRSALAVCRDRSGRTLGAGAYADSVDCVPERASGYGGFGAYVRDGGGACWTTPRLPRRQRRTDRSYLDTERQSISRLSGVRTKFRTVRPQKLVFFFFFNSFQD